MFSCLTDVFKLCFNNVIMKKAIAFYFNDYIHLLTGFVSSVTDVLSSVLG